MVGKREAVALLMFANIACIDAGDERAKLDLEVGTATLGSALIETEDGLGHIRSMTEGEIVIWSQAPVYSIHLDPGDQETWNLVFRNALFDMDILLEDGTRIECQTLDVPTKRSCKLNLTEPTTVTLVVDDEEGEPLTFALFADVQKSVDRVHELFSKMAEQENVRFALMSGDLTDVGSPHELDRFQTELERLPYPVYATLGNHELGSGEDNFHNFFGRGNYSFEFTGRRFTLLDSASATIPNLSKQWLDEWLDQGQNQFHAVAMHIPPFDPIGGRNAGFASRNEGRELVSSFKQHNVDLTLYGHVHSYHEYSNAGIPAFISGGGGAADERLDGIERHFVVFDLPGKASPSMLVDESDASTYEASASPPVFTRRLVRVD